ncbi:crAss001_48 related protein [Buttiauxella agrestis]|uniref:crAss001_48 related protein n=1 Tax=Buttiauxella agrestis TaxID=82977 RepID=UPI0039747532
MPPHQVRVIEELWQLRDRLENLNTFINGNGVIFASLEEGEKMLLRLQATHMADYADVLESRIAAFSLSTVSAGIKQ